MKDPKDEVPMSGTSESPEDSVGAKPLTTPSVMPESRFERFLRRALRWLVGLLIVFVLGALTSGLLLYRPVQQERDRLQAEFDAANNQIVELETQVASLKLSENKIKALQGELDQASLHVILLSALSDVNAARLALVNDDQAGAKVHLTNTPATLKDLESLLGTNHREIVLDMQSRLKLAIDEMAKDDFAAQSDLGVLATNLVQLENIFFAGP